MASTGDPKTPLKLKLQDPSKEYNPSPYTAFSSALKRNTIPKPPHYLGEKESAAASVPAESAPEPILRKRPAPSEGEHAEEPSRRTKTYQYYTTRYDPPPLSTEEPVVGPSGEWVYGSDANKVVKDMPRPVPMVYYPMGIHNYRRGGPANTVGQPFRVGATDNAFAPLPTGIEDFSESAMSKMAMGAFADKEWLKKMAGFDPAYMLQNKLLKEVPTSSAAMAKAANAWVDLDYDHPLKVRRRQMLPTAPDYADQPSLHLQYKSIMEKLDRLKTQHFKGALPFKPLPANASTADKAKLTEYNIQADAILRAGVDKYRELTAQLHPGIANNLIHRVDPIALEGAARLQFQIDFKIELKRLHDIRREIKAITHQHDIVWKDKISDSAEIRRNKTNHRRQLRAELQDAITRADAQKAVAYGWVEQEGGKTTWLENRQAQAKNGIVPQDGATLPVAMTRWLVQSTSGQVVSKASMARQSDAFVHVDEDIVMADSGIPHTHARRYRSHSEATEYPETSPVTWSILSQTSNVIERCNITRGVAKGGGDSEALRFLTYINTQPGKPETATDYVRKARRLEDFFLILETVMAKVRAEEAIARMELEKPYESDLPPSTPSSDEEMEDAPLLDNSGAYSAKANMSSPKYWSDSTSKSEDSEHSSREESPPSPTIIHELPDEAVYEDAKGAGRRGSSAKPGVHFTPPDAKREEPKTPPKPSTWRPPRQPTPKSALQSPVSSPPASIFQNPSQFLMDSSPTVPTTSPQVTPPQRGHGHGVGPRSIRGGRQSQVSSPRVTQSQPPQEERTPLRRGRSARKQVAPPTDTPTEWSSPTPTPTPLTRGLPPLRLGRGHGRVSHSGRGGHGGHGGGRNRLRTLTPEEEAETQEESEEQSQRRSEWQEETLKRLAGNSPQFSGDLDIIEEDSGQFMDAQGVKEEGWEEVVVEGGEEEEKEGEEEGGEEEEEEEEEKEGEEEEGGGEEDDEEDEDEDEDEVSIIEEDSNENSEQSYDDTDDSENDYSA